MQSILAPIRQCVLALFVLVILPTCVDAQCSITFHSLESRICVAERVYYGSISKMKKTVAVPGLQLASLIRQVPKQEKKKTAPAPVAPTDFEPLLSVIETARKSNKLAKSRAAGGPGGGPFESALEEPALLVGFEYTTSTLFAGHMSIKSVRPIYQTREGETSGKWYGSPHGKIQRVQGKEDYVVTAIMARHGDRLDGLRLIYMRVQGARLNPDDTYRSEWLGGKGGGAPTLYATYGNPVVSVFGRRGNDLDAIGFVQVDTK